MGYQNPKYDFSHPLFKKNFLLRRLAKEHLNVADLDSDVIKFEVIKTRSDLKIPSVYHIHYHLKSIVAIDDNQDPVYGDHHVVEVSLPPKYPLEPAKIYMHSEAWHPNIKSEGKFKGRICGNTRDFGKGYDLYQLVLRVGEILQYKNYHAVHTPPFPEDAKVANWVLQYAEPNDIVNKHKGIVVDETPLLNAEEEKPKETTVQSPKEAEAPKVTKPSPPVEEKASPKIKVAPKITIGKVKKVAPSKIKIKPKN